MVGIMGCGGPGTKYLLYSGSGILVLCPLWNQGLCVKDLSS